MPGVRGPAGDMRVEYQKRFERTKRRLRREREANGTFCCEGCWRHDCQLDFHHVISILEIVQRELPVELIWDATNLALACRRTEGGREVGCHLVIAHDPDGTGKLKPKWTVSNPFARRDLNRHLAETRTEPC